MAKLPHTTTTTSSVAYRDDLYDSRPNGHATQAGKAAQPRKAAEPLSDPTIWQMAHELRDPLTSILGFAQMLLDPKSSQPLDQQQQHYVDRILDSGHHLIAVINEMLDVAAMGTGHSQIERSPLDPRTLLTEVRDQLAPQAQDKQQRVILQTPTALTPVNADHVRMRQVLLNLLGNAIKFAPQGSEIILGAQPADNATDFFVQNRGPVIPRAYHRFIFEAFARVPPAPNAGESPHGTGLGLTIAQNLVRQHGGTIWVRSNQRHGTTFWVRLPR